MIAAWMESQLARGPLSCGSTRSMPEREPRNRERDLVRCSWWDRFAVPTQRNSAQRPTGPTTSGHARSEDEERYSLHGGADKKSRQPRQELLVWRTERQSLQLDERYPVGRCPHHRAASHPGDEPRARESSGAHRIPARPNLLAKVIRMDPPRRRRNRVWVRSRSGGVVHGSSTRAILNGSGSAIEARPAERRSSRSGWQPSSEGEGRNHVRAHTASRTQLLPPLWGSDSTTQVRRGLNVRRCRLGPPARCANHIESGSPNHAAEIPQDTGYHARCER
jgi:hypothetical protein